MYIWIFFSVSGIYVIIIFLVASLPFHARPITCLTAFLFPPPLSIPATRALFTQHCVVQLPVFGCFLYDHTSLNVDISYLKSASQAVIT